jgi:predicted lipid-binding transport protein (Tim44 family)
LGSWREQRMQRNASKQRPVVKASGAEEATPNARHPSQQITSSSKRKHSYVLASGKGGAHHGGGNNEGQQQAHGGKCRGDLQGTALQHGRYPA